MRGEGVRVCGVRGVSGYVSIEWRVWGYERCGVWREWCW